MNALEVVAGVLHVAGPSSSDKPCNICLDKAAKVLAALTEAGYEVVHPLEAAHAGDKGHERITAMEEAHNRLADGVLDLERRLISLDGVQSEQIRAWTALTKEVARAHGRLDKLNRERAK